MFLPFHRPSIKVYSFPAKVQSCLEASEIMTTANQASSPVGFNDVQLSLKEFDFRKAFNFIKGKVSDEFIREHWHRSLLDASRMCRICELDHWKNISLSWYSIKFLDVLWDLLFGRTTGPSPWHHFLSGLPWHKLNGITDRTIPTDLFNNAPGFSEITIQGLFKYLPMKLVMPDSVILTSPTKPPKRQAPESPQMPSTKRLCQKHSEQKPACS
ncbi:hypothetical protein F4776DRAFT_618873 [Hypoxylon sp. NC0597]|nr:hypothetical protein F4776DRAFT_618873 [Hypoxylon sp. NC0597]